MTIHEQNLKTSLHKAITQWSEREAQKKQATDWDSLAVYVHPDFESDMTDAAWAVFQAMVKSQAYQKENE